MGVMYVPENVPSQGTRWVYGIYVRTPRGGLQDDTPTPTLRVDADQMNNNNPKVGEVDAGCEAVRERKAKASYALQDPSEDRMEFRRRTIQEYRPIGKLIGFVRRRSWLCKSVTSAIFRESFAHERDFREQRALVRITVLLPFVLMWTPRSEHTAKSAHPDKGGTEQKRVALNEVYKVVCNPGEECLFYVLVPIQII
ncbi:hypothetical protein B0H11DRAFT_1936093 [Mycena galericulata]|nr:hypothetical protein B0H11DRAFT_1936093 [Mycena galericulata]